MKTYNYRHKLQTINKALEPTGHKFGHIMEAGKDTYLLKEVCLDSTSGWRVCGYYYSASQVAEVTNKILAGVIK